MCQGLWWWYYFAYSRDPGPQPIWRSNLLCWYLCNAGGKFILKSSSKTHWENDACFHISSMSSIELWPWSAAMKNWKSKMIIDSNFYGSVLRKADKLSATKCEYSHWSTWYSKHMWFADKSQVNLWAFVSTVPLLALCVRVNFWG